MKINEIIFESPQVVSPTDFDLGDTIINKKFAKTLLKKVRETIEDTADYSLLRTGDDNTGYIAIYDKYLKMLAYIVKFETDNLPFIGRSVTQIALWRMLGNPNVVGKTQEIFFGYLLQHWSSIISDGEQTEDGSKFWKDRMGEADRKGYRVGLANIETQSIEWKDPSVNVTEWILKMGAWGKSPKFKALRFVIAN
jgi:hypothetical protein